MRAGTKLMPEKLRGILEWKTSDGNVLRLVVPSGFLVAVWNPYARHKGSRGAVSIYGEPRGKTVSYKTWKGWKDAVWRHYRVRPPKEYAVLHDLV